MKPVLLATATIPLLALVASRELYAQAQSPQNVQNAQRQRNQARMRMMRLVGLAEALGLDEAQALRIHETMRPFDERRGALEVENAGLARLVKQAADGDAGALGQVDQALQRMFDNRAEIQQINRQMLEAVGQQLSARQRAQMAVFFATFGDELREAQRRAQERARQDALQTAVDRARANPPK